MGTIEELLQSRPSENRLETVKLRAAVERLCHGSEAERADAIRVLLSLGARGSSLLVAALETLPLPSATQALEGLARTQPAGLASCLADLLGAQNPELRLLAVRWADRLDDEQAKPLLKRALADAHPELRRRALTYVGWRRSLWAQTDVLVLCRDPDPEVEWAALETLAVLNPAVAREMVQTRLPRLDPIKLRRAVFLLERKDLP